MSVEIEVKSNFEVECTVCGGTLEAKLGGKYSWGSDTIKVEPCKQCIEDASDKAIKEHLEGSAS